jgi:hypothetical protein
VIEQASSQGFGAALARVLELQIGVAHA